MPDEQAQRGPLSNVLRSTVPQVVAPLFLTVVLFFVVAEWVFLPSFREAVMARKLETVQVLSQTASSAVYEFVRKADLGELPLAEAQAQAAEMVRQLRYGVDDRDYFWINDFEPRMIMHPYRPELNGQSLLDYADPNGKRLFVEMAAVARERGEGYVEYLWQWKDDPTRVVPKVSHVRRIKDWDWVIGTGVYLDDAHAEILAMTRRIHAILLSVVAAAIVLSLIAIRHAMAVEWRRVRAESKLRSSETRLRSIVANTAEIIFTLTPAGVFDFVSPSWERTLGYGGGEAIGRTFATLVHSEDLAVCEAAFERIMTTDVSVRNIECRLRNADGQWRWFRVTGAPVRAEAGAPRYCVGIADDITERRAAEDALKRSERQLALATEAARIACWEYESLSGMLRCTPLWYEMLDLKQDQVTPSLELWHSLVHPDDRTRVDGLFDRIAEAAGLPYSLEYRLRANSGAWRWFESRGRAVEHDPNGRATRLAGTLVDVTERKHAEERAAAHRRELMQADKMISLGVLVAGVAHEINNPNFVIMASAGTLSTIWDELTPVLDAYAREHGDFAVGELDFSELREEMPEMLAALLDGSERIRRIVQELRDFARHESLETNDLVDLNEAVKSAASLVSTMIRKSTQRFSVAYAPFIPLLKGSRGRLEQVLVNLIQNACQALTDPMQAISVTVTYDVERACAVVAVQDEGAGITESDLKHVSDPFFTTKRAMGGMGLGLSVSTTIAEEHGGKLLFDSVPGKGTTVSLVLPVRQTLDEGDNGSSCDQEDV